MRKLALVLFVLVGLSASIAHAGGVSVDQSKVLDRWSLRIGGFLTGLDTTIRFDNPITGEAGTEIDFEDDLGFSSSESVPKLRLAFILGKRHELSAGWYETDRDSTTTITSEIEWGDETFPINTDVTAFYKTVFYDVAYTYYFYTSESTALGARVGFVYAELSAGLGIAFLGQGIELEDDINTDVPVPQLGFSLSHYLGARFLLRGGLGYIAFNLDDWEGDVTTASLGIEHRTWKNFGFGAGYNYSNYDVDANSTDFLGNAKYTIDGFEIYARAAW